MRLAWLSDIHLNFLDERRRVKFIESVAARGADAAVISGDIADGWTVIAALEAFASRVACPVYCVLGNHDFYGRGIGAVRADVRAATQGTRVTYLADAGVVELAPGIALVGHDGWADGREGDYASTPFRTNDFVHIQDFQVFGGGFGAKEQRLRLMQHLADEAAAHFAHHLPIAAAKYSHVIAVTHVPPFAGASRYRGRPTGPDALPFYASRCVGETMLDVMARFPTCRLTVLAGHTHAAATYQAAANVEVRTASATYGRPRVSALLNVDEHGVR